MTVIIMEMTKNNTPELRKELKKFGIEIDKKAKQVVIENYARTSRIIVHEIKETSVETPIKAEVTNALLTEIISSVIDDNNDVKANIEAVEKALKCVSKNDYQIEYLETGSTEEKVKVGKIAKDKYELARKTFGFYKQPMPRKEKQA